MFLIFDVSFLIEVENKLIALEHMPSKFICLPVAEIRRVFTAASPVIVSRLLQYFAQATSKDAD